MESDLQTNLHHQQQMNSGLLRYRSAPSSYFASFLQSEDCEEFLNHRATSPETEQYISRFFTTADSAAHGGDGDGEQFMAPLKVEEESNYSPDVQVMYQDNDESDLLPTRNESRGSGLGVDQVPEMNSDLIRHSSSPAGLFSHMNTENGYVTMRGMSKFKCGNGNGNTSGAASFPSPTSRMKNQMNFTSGPPSSSGLMKPTSPKNENFEENCSSSSFITPFPSGSWDDSALMTDNFQGLKRARYDTVSGLNGLENQNIGTRNPSLLSHHLSLPKTSSEMAAMDNLLQFEDSVPCRSRAKRGCATHPRSIAERVRRTRISERMRKLQELVPNMDKQTNTADMLDLAVDYIKDLQKDVKTLEDNRTKCTCSSKQNL